MYTTGHVHLPQIQFPEIWTYIHSKRYHREKIHPVPPRQLEEEHQGLYTGRGVLRNNQREIRHSSIEKRIQGIYGQVWEA